MNKVLRQVIHWTSFILILVVIVATIVFPLVSYMIMLFTGKGNEAPIKEWIDIVISILGIVSVGLGAFSVYQAKSATKETEKIINGIENIKELQTGIYFRLNNGKLIEHHEATPSNAPWNVDQTNE